jgi:hypothetical protein
VMRPAEGLRSSYCSRSAARRRPADSAFGRDPARSILLDVRRITTRMVSNDWTPSGSAGPPVDLRAA